MNKEALIALLNEFGITPDSNFKDQHFMVSEEVIQKVVSIADISPRDNVLEIGPGPGQLTEEILNSGAYLTVIELDERFKGILTRLQNKFPERLQIIWGSALEVKWPHNINKIVMNPPYSILEALLEKIHGSRGVECVSMIIGKRYCENACIRIGDRGFMRTSLMTQAKFDPKLIMNISRECFYPKENGISVVMLLSAKERPHPMLSKIADFFVESPEINLKFVLTQVLESVNKSAKKHRDYEKFVTVNSLGINSNLYNKRLQDLSNQEIAQIINKLTFLFNKKSAQTKRPKSKIDLDEDE
jgi:16S rRNA (adenine1518-N6/adenine1519-N6)-dimethyltransferase